MRVIKNENGLPIKLWADYVEDGAMEQIEHLSKLPFVFKHIAIMPDVHQGYGMPIGGVMATQGVVVPNAVGVDIGCGMCAVETSLKEKDLDTETLKEVMGEIREVIPVGFNHQKEKQPAYEMPRLEYPIDIPSECNKYPVCREYENARSQIGTLGGGNHFIEIQKSSKGNVWIMLHSGSRNLGYKVARFYNELAVKLNSKWFSKVPKEWELAFLPLDSDEGENYLREMQYCVDFALANRSLMMDRIKEVIGKHFPNTSFQEMINIAHNYAVMENHFRKNVMVHRKGATRARKGEIGIIPSSQGTASYIVEGLGNPQSFQSCSHGAGRVMGRNQARKELSLEDEVKRLDDKNILHSIRTVEDLDEASGAYKDIDVVMKNQEELVKIIEKLEPMAIIKG